MTDGFEREARSLVERGGAALVLGPFTVGYGDAGLATDGSVVCTLPPGTLVLDVAVVVDEAWDVATAFSVHIGGNDYGPPNDDYGPLFSLPDLQTVSNSFAVGAGWVAPALNINDPGEGRSRYGYVSTAGALVAYAPGGGGAGQGSLRVWATVASRG